ncbi:hypothetical protein EYC84_004608 [Monilinia fructicola]|uniref:Uncharacterized protein n=1 Tax=Monilinia fructicola TaxID=38448 RepID=A0A5M9K3E8_MONFR|nr:hypothetical protein EYC84_004608 [Monilinia fructicola]
MDDASYVVVVVVVVVDDADDDVNLLHVIDAVIEDIDHNRDDDSDADILEWKGQSKVSSIIVGMCKVIICEDIFDILLSRCDDNTTFVHPSNVMQVILRYYLIQIINRTIILSADRRAHQSTVRSVRICQNVLPSHDKTFFTSMSKKSVMQRGLCAEFPTPTPTKTFQQRERDWRSLISPFNRVIMLRTGALSRSRPFKKSNSKINKKPMHFPPSCSTSLPAAWALPPIVQ